MDKLSHIEYPAARSLTWENILPVANPRLGREERTWRLMTLAGLDELSVGPKRFAEAKQLLPGEYKSSRAKIFLVDEIVPFYVRLGQTDLARSITESLDDEVYRGWAYRNLFSLTGAYHDARKLLDNNLQVPYQELRCKDLIKTARQCAVVGFDDLAAEAYLTAGRLEKQSKGTS